MVSVAALAEKPQVIDEQLFHTSVRGETDSAETRSVIALGLILAVLQIADGCLTSIGVSRFGIEAEGNPLLRGLMVQFGHIPTLALVKCFAIVVVCLLTIMAMRMPWVKGAMSFVSAIYLFAAIIPWTYILFVKPLAI